jgi:hypothetical protein
MRSTNAMYKALLAFSIIGIVAGAAFFSGGMCGGGGGSHYETPSTFAAK